MRLENIPDHQEGFGFALKWPIWRTNHSNQRWILTDEWMGSNYAPTVSHLVNTFAPDVGMWEPLNPPNCVRTVDTDDDVRPYLDALLTSCTNLDSFEGVGCDLIGDVSKVEINNNEVEDLRAMSILVDAQGAEVARVSTATAEFLTSGWKPSWGVTTFEYDTGDGPIAVAFDRKGRPRVFIATLEAT